MTIGHTVGSRDHETHAERRLALPVVLFLLSLVIPFVLLIGPLRLSVYRIVLIAVFLPCLFWWLSGRAGRIRLADIALLFLCFWSALAATIHHGLGASVESSGILTLETMGAYLLARCLIRDADSFFRMVRILFLIVAAMLPAAIFESVTGQNIMRIAFDAIYPSYKDIYMLPRWGLRRVQGPFEHPILFGVFCSSAVALAHLVLGYGRSWIVRSAKTVVVGTTAFLSLSSGPLIAMGVQVVLLGWNDILRRVRSRWKILAGAALAMGVVIETFSNRSIPQILISLFAFNSSTAWNRLRIWDYGSASVLNHPLLGIGYGGDWERPAYMVSSVDMFWLVPPLRFGLPAGIALQVAVLSIFLGCVFRRGLTERQSQYRTGYLICMLGFYMSGWTVHFWNATYVLFLFLLGSGVWLLDARPDTEDAPPPRLPEEKPGPIYRRDFSKTAQHRRPSPEPPR